MSSYLYNIFYGSVGYNIAPLIPNAVSPFAAMAGAATAPSAPKPTQFVQQGFPMPPKAPTVTVPTAPSSGGGGDGQPSTGGTTFQDGIISGQGTPAGGITIGPPRLATAEQYAEAAQVGGYLDKVKGQVGLQTQVNPLSGTVGVTAPGFMGFMGAGFISPIAAGMSKFMQDKQTQAVQNALAIDNTQNGVISINGMNVSIVNGKLYGNIGELDYNTVRKAALNYLQENPYSPPSIPGAAQEQVEDTMAYSYGEVGRVPSGSYEVGRVIGSEPSAPSSPSSASEGSSGSSNGNDPAGGGSGPGSGIGGQMGGPRAYGGLVGFAAGGRVGMANGDLALNPGQAGFVDGPPEQFTPAQTVADTENGQVQEGSFVINAPAVEFAGSDDIREMILNAYSTAKEKGLDIGSADRTIYEETVDVALSKGEVVVPPALVKIIGLDRLRKINNRGKREVGERQQQAAKGGFINGYADGDVVEGPYGGIEALTAAYQKYQKKFPSVSQARTVTDEIVASLPAEDVLALLMMGEASILGDEGMRGVAHVAVNRTDSEYEDFADQQDIYDVATKKTGGGIFQFNAFEPTTFRRTLKDITQTEYGKAKYERIRNDAEEILAGVQEDFTKGSLFFWNPTTSTDPTFKKKVASGEWIPQAKTQTNSSLHEYLAPRM